MSEETPVAVPPTVTGTVEVPPETDAAMRQEVLGNTGMCQPECPSILALHDLVRFSMMFHDLMESEELCRGTSLARDNNVRSTFNKLIDHIYHMICEAFKFACVHSIPTDLDSQLKTITDAASAIDGNNTYKEMFTASWLNWIKTPRILKDGNDTIMHGYAVPIDYVEFLGDKVSYTENPNPRAIFIPASDRIETNMLIGEISVSEEDEDFIRLI